MYNVLIQCCTKEYSTHTCITQMLQNNADCQQITVHEALFLLCGCYVEKNQFCNYLFICLYWLCAIAAYISDNKLNSFLIFGLKDIFSISAMKVLRAQIHSTCEKNLESMAVWPLRPICLIKHYLSHF